MRLILRTILQHLQQIDSVCLREVMRIENSTLGDLQSLQSFKTVHFICVLAIQTISGHLSREGENQQGIS